MTKLAVKLKPILPDIDRLAVVADARTDAEGEVPLGAVGVGLDGVVEVVGHGGSVRQLERHAVTVNQRTVEAGDDPLKYFYSQLFLFCMNINIKAT